MVVYYLAHLLGFWHLGLFLELTFWVYTAVLKVISSFPTFHLLKLHLHHRGFGYPQGIFLFLCTLTMGGFLLSLSLSHHPSMWAFNPSVFIW